MKRLLFSILFVLNVLNVANAGTVSRYFNYETDSEVNSNNLNGNFNNIVTVLNGAVDNTNVNTTAGFRLYEVLGVLPTAATLGRTVFYTVDKSLNFDTGSEWKKTQASLNTNPGFALPSGAVFFMITGSCPTGTTDVTTTYSNKFIKINATQGTSSGTVLTGTSDSHTLTTTEMPAHTHTTDSYCSTISIIAGTSNVQGTGDTASFSMPTTSTGSGGGHTHTLSSATTLEPSSITCKMCQVN